MTEATNMTYTKKSPGCENLADSLSSPLPYWNKKYGSSMIENFGLVMRNAVTTRHISGNCLSVKMASGYHTNRKRLMRPVCPSADTTTAPAVMVL